MAATLAPPDDDLFPEFNDLSNPQARRLWSEIDCSYVVVPSQPSRKRQQQLRATFPAEHAANGAERPAGDPWPLPVTIH